MISLQAVAGRVSTLASPTYSFTPSLFLDLSYGLTIKSFINQLDIQTSVLFLVFLLP